MVLVDSHAHLNDGRFRHDLPAVLERAAAAGVKAVVNVGFNLDSSRRGVKLAARHAPVHAAVGFHPHEARNFSPVALAELRILAAAQKVVAIGEIGLDYYYLHSPAAAQKEAFTEQLRLAREINLPVIVHDRDAHQETLSILQEEGLPAAGGVMHCFSGDVAFAVRCLEMGLYLSLAGTITFKQTGNLAEVARHVPLQSLLVETDAPYLAPVPFRGQRNEPAYVASIVQRIAGLRGEEPETVARITSENALRLFGAGLCLCP